MAISDPAKDLLDQAAHAIRQGDTARGEQLLRVVLADNPRNVLALLWLTKCTEDPVRRASLFEKALFIEPQNPHALKGVEHYRRFSSPKPADESRPLPPEAQSQRLQSQPAGITSARTCPFCSSRVAISDTACPSCDRVLPTMAAAPNNTGGHRAQSNLLETRVSLYVQEGYSLVSLTPEVAILKIPKEFNWVALLIFWTFYLIYYFVQSEKQVALRVLSTGAVEESGYTLRESDSDERFRRNVLIAIGILALLLLAVCVLTPILSR